MNEAPTSTPDTAYHRNPSLFGLAAGAAMGLIDGALAHAAASLFVPEARELALLLYLASGGTMIGAFFGGIIGLRAHGADWPRERTIRALFLAQSAYLALLLVAIVARALNT